MAVLAQGTNVYFRDPADDTIVAVECATAFNPGGSPSDQIDTTCLEDTTRSYMRGLRTPGQASLTVNADPQYPSHIRLHELSQSDDQGYIEFYVGWSDGTEAPTIDGTTSEITLPTSRTWFTFEGYVADFPMDFASNSVVSTTASIQRSGGSAWVPKTVTP